MGSFGYICKGCKTGIREYEKTIMFHVRHGEIVGQVEGHYDSYGRVYEHEELDEDKKYRGYHDGINGHDEICNSEFFLDDSYMKVLEKRIYEGKIFTLDWYIYKKIQEDSEKHEEDLTKSKFYKLLDDEEKEDLKKFSEENTIMARMIFNTYIDIRKHLLFDEYREEFNNLEKIIFDKYSGTAAWHSFCYNKASEEDKNNLIPSLNDENQACGKPRKKYI